MGFMERIREIAEQAEFPLHPEGPDIFYVEVVDPVTKKVARVGIEVREFENQPPRVEFWAVVHPDAAAMTESQLNDFLKWGSKTMTWCPAIVAFTDRSAAIIFKRIPLQRLGPAAMRRAVFGIAYEVWLVRNGFGTDNI